MVVHMRSVKTTPRGLCKVCPPCLFSTVQMNDLGKTILEQEVTATSEDRLFQLFSLFMRSSTLSFFVEMEETSFLPDFRAHADDDGLTARLVLSTMH